MRAILWTTYGGPDALQLGEAERPVAAEGEILVKVHATTVTMGDCEMRSLRLPMGLGLPMRLYAGLWRPRRLEIMGQEFAGEVVEVGTGVTRFKEGDRVFGAGGFGSGTYAEYITVPDVPGDMDGPTEHMPSNMSFEEAAALPLGGLESVHFLRRANIRPGHKVLVVGAGGSIGTAGVQIAQHFGAEVACVDSGDKLEMLRSLGATEVIDYTAEDFTRTGKTYDVIFDVVGKTPLGRAMRSLTDMGTYLLANPSIWRMLRGWWMARTSQRRFVAAAARRTVEELVFLKELAEAGELRTIIDRRYPLEQMAEAHAYVESGRKAGNVVVTVAEPQSPLDR